MLHAISALILLVTQTAPQACTWGSAREIGAVEQVIDEASGVAVSRRIPNRLYHNNDSGDTGRFFVTDLAGRETRIVNVKDFNPVDAEDIALGPCGAGIDCIFIADIGDNGSTRPQLELVVVEEQQNFPAEVQPRFRIRIRYPDAPHDAESLSVHPDGSIYIITKNRATATAPAGIAQIYRLKADQWRAPKNNVETLELVTTFDLGKLMPGSIDIGRLPTAMDIAPDGKRFLLLTYTDAIEFLFDLSGSIPPADRWKPGEQYNRISLTILEQQEAIAYLPDGKSFLYETERPAPGSRARIMRVDCSN